MSDNSASIVSKVWNYAHVLKNAGVGYGDYVEQITYLLFLKLADEMTELGFDNPIPKQFAWSKLSSKSGDDLEVHYRHTLENLGKVPGLVGIIFRKAQNKISNPSDLQRVIKMIGDEDWSGMDVDIKGAIYEGLLEKTASSSDKGAGQYFTPRPLIRAIVDVMAPTTANKQLNFLQHIVSELKVGGTAAVVLPDNVLFEGGAGETIRRELLKRCNVHTLLRLPTGIFYAQGVKANVLFFERKEASEKPWTQDLWIYDLRTNQHFTLKTNPLKEADLVDFVDCYQGRDSRPAGPSSSPKAKESAPRAASPYRRKETERFRRFTYAEIVARDKANLDILWLKDDSLEDSENLPPPAELAAEIVESLEAALEEFRAVEEALLVPDEP
jgi:type I restriction-modification system DNA methylase subunit